MGRVRTAAAKKYIQTPTSDDDENLGESKRSSRAKRTSTSNNTPATPRASTSRTSRSTKNGKANGKNGVESKSNSSLESDDETPIVNRKRKSSVETPSPKKQKSSTSGAAAKNKADENKGKRSVTSQSNAESSELDSDKEETTNVESNRKSSVEKTSPKKQKPSTSAGAAKSKSSSNKSAQKKKKKKKEEEEERYEVEAILDHKFEDNTKYFLIRWKGYDESADSWQNQYSISCPALLAKYYEEHPEASVSAKRKKKPGKKQKEVIPKVRPLKIDQQLDYNSDWDENEDYEVERILDVYIHRNNKREFLIRWKGYSSNSDSWEPEENLDCGDLIEKFMSKVEKSKNASQKDLRPFRSQTQRFTLMTQAAARRLSKRNVDRQRAVYYDCDE